MFCVVVGESTIITHKLIQRSLNSYLLNCILAKHIVIRHYKNYINYDLTHGNNNNEKTYLSLVEIAHSFSPCNFICTSLFSILRSTIIF